MRTSHNKDFRSGDRVLVSARLWNDPLSVVALSPEISPELQFQRDPGVLIRDLLKELSLRKKYHVLGEYCLTPENAREVERIRTLETARNLAGRT